MRFLTEAQAQQEHLSTTIDVIVRQCPNNDWHKSQWRFYDIVRIGGVDRKRYVCSSKRPECYDKTCFGTSKIFGE